MLYPCDNHEFSVPVAFHSKAQCESNGYHPFGEYWNVVEHDRDAFRVSLSAPTDFVAPLDNGITIIYETRLGNCSCIALLPSVHGHIAMSADKLTETLITTRVEH